MRIKVMNKGKLQDTIIPENVAIISFYEQVTDSIVKTQKYSLAKNESILRADKSGLILCICADDVNIEFHDPGSNPISYLTEQQATDIVNFIIKNKDKTFVFQCEYGNSRSGATAMFAYKYILKEHIFKNQPKESLNESFYRMFEYVYEKIKNN